MKINYSLLKVAYFVTGLINSDKIWILCIMWTLRLIGWHFMSLMLMVYDDTNRESS